MSYRQELAVGIIEAYMYDLKEPTANCPREVFLKRSMFLWAANEIMRTIYEEQIADTEPIDIINDFIYEFLHIRDSTMNTRKRLMFTAAACAAEEIKTLLL